MVKNKNQRRENKAYSHEDQMMAEEYKEKKRRAEQQKNGGVNSLISQLPDGVSKKQIELATNELAREVKVREHATKVS